MGRTLTRFLIALSLTLFSALANASWKGFRGVPGPERPRAARGKMLGGGATVAVVILGILAGCAGRPEDRARDLARHADVAWEEGRYEAALDLWEKARAVLPEDDTLSLRLAEAYGQRYQWDKAAALCRDVLDRSPNHVQAWRQTAVLAMAFGRMDEALRAVETLKHLDPEGAESLALQGDFHVLQGQAEAALEAYDGARHALHAAKTASAETFKEAVASSRAETMEGVLRVKKAACLIAMGRRDEALHELADMAAVPPRSSEVWAHVGRVWELMGDSERAAKAYETAFAMHCGDLSPMVRRIRLALKENKVQEAEAALHRLEQAGAPSSVVGKLRIEGALQAGAPQQAAHLLASLRSKGFLDVELRLMEAKILLFQDHPAAALLILEKILDLEPHIPLAQYLAGLAHLRLHHVRLAQKAMIRALELQPSFTEARLVLAATYYKLKEMEPARAHAQKLAEREPENSQARFLLALVAAEEGAVDEAGRHVKAMALLGADPRRLEAVKALVWEKSENLNDAVKAALGFWDALPEDADAAWQAVSLLCRSGRAEEGLERLARTQNQNPKAVAIQVLGGDLARCTGRRDLATAFYEKALALEADTASAYRGLLRCEAGSREATEKILKDFLEHVRHSPEPAAAWADHARAQGETTKARKILEETLKAHPESGVPANNLAWLYLESNECLDKALALAQQAYDRLPDRAEVLDTLGYAYFKKGLLTRALWYLSEARTRDPANPFAAYHLGLLYAAQNDGDQARLHLEAALRLGLPPETAAQAAATLSQLSP
mgnify:CR=1 FL=1|uniref:Tetratricopeptide repeat protein n=1 Tax=Desulfacinum infernum TaxID=35837 RepID=A0A832A4Q7_9BACT